MRVNTKYSVALHCLVLIADYGDHKKVTSELLGRSTGCNAAAIRSILNTLKKAGIVSVVRGSGGAHLNRAPREINLWEVYSAIEPDGLDRLICFHPHPFEGCPVGRNIYGVLKGPCEEIGQAMRKSMEGITLMHLLERYHRVESVSYQENKDSTSTEV